MTKTNEAEPRPTALEDALTQHVLDIQQLMREAFDAGFNAGWDADGTPLTFTERMDEAWAEYQQRASAAP